MNFTENSEGEVIENIKKNVWGISKMLKGGREVI